MENRICDPVGPVFLPASSKEVDPAAEEKIEVQPKERRKRK
jgi:hypothetical protein